jgi:hypothetical protein
MSDEFRKRLSDAKTRVQEAKQKSEQAAAPGSADDTRRQSELHSGASIWNRVKAPLIEQAVRVANQELADIGIRLSTSDFSSFSPGGMSLPGIRITVERQLDPRLPHPTGGRDPGAPSLQDAAQASSVAIAVNHDGAVSIAASNCNISVKGVIPLDQFCERHIETIIADFVDQLTTAAVT